MCITVMPCTRYQEYKDNEEVVTTLKVTYDYFKEDTEKQAYD